jgi:AraC-like DNA-binding protein
MLYDAQDLMYCTSLAVYVAVSVVVAIVRWGHKCEPYARHMDYYYPAWKAVVGCFLTSLVLLPCIFLPHDPDAIMEVRMMLLLASPFCCATILFSYFGKVLGINWWRRPVYVLAFFFGYLMLTALVHTLTPGNQLENGGRRVLFGFTGVFSLLFLASFIVAFWMVVRPMRFFSKENYSNPRDFPHHYASRVIILPFLYIAISWITASIGTPLVLSAGLLIHSVLNVVFLIGVLSPHRARDVERFEAEKRPSEEEADAAPLGADRQEEILSALHRAMTEEEAFLDSHLTLASLSRMCGVNRTYVSRVMNDCLGGFFVYVNRCRLDYADRLREENPGMSVDEVALASGFGSRQSYYNIRRSLKR